VPGPGADPARRIDDGSQARDERSRGIGVERLDPGGPVPVLPDPLDPRVAAALGPALARAVVEETPDAFAAAGALRRASAALRGALDTEQAAEGADAVAHAAWRQSHDRLLDVGTATTDALRGMTLRGVLGAQALHAAVTRDLARWADPYAPDAADLSVAVDTARTDGARRDRAEADRARAIAARDHAVRAWRAAAAALLAHADASVEPLLVELRGEPGDDPADGWFEE
jgi:hypothetical protein